MKQKRDLFLCITCLLIALLLSLAHDRSDNEALAARIAPEILRFHVLANSNSTKDQNLKLKVRTMLLNSIYEDLGENASLEETKTYIRSHEFILEKKAENYMKNLGFNYPAHMELAYNYFPTKIYGDMVFPCGTYEAVRVKIGEGKGHNWWCVLYPPLCFTDSTYAVVPDTSKKILEHSIDESDYLKLRKEPLKIHVRLKVLDLLAAGKKEVTLPSSK
ncbi:MULTISPECIES: stage II sporulation protein R [Lacrimispora]|jgi:stage II sporulation protein R|uniref:stage II sporulation protein R n=1 Tax=Lacrimispora TaxID=2719231 RepID=UPI000BE36501|nr:stage II sporulation protein R [Lacrimispora amygdalina]MDK2968289.1 stage sporulation protein [Lacrimispora sp.]